MDLAAYETIVGRIYDAATNPLDWPGILEGIADLTGGNGAWLSRLNVSDGTGSGIVVRMDPSAQLNYFSHYNSVDPLCNVDDSEGRLQPPAPYVITDEDRLSKPELLRTEFYNDFMTTVDAYSVLIFRLAARGPTVYGLNVNRGRTHGRFDAADLRVARSLQGHVSRSLHIAQRFEAYRLLEMDGVGRAPHTRGLLLLDGGGRILLADAAAEDLLTRKTGLRVVNGRLDAADPLVSQRLQALISRAASRAQAVRRAGRVTIPADGDDLPLVVAVAPSPPGCVPVFGGDHCAVLSLMAAEPVGAVSTTQLADLFGLTVAEARVTRALANGQSIREIAESGGVSLHTIRSHVARIFTKTGVRRQTELLLLLAQLPGAAGAVPHGVGSGGRPARP